jgi:hypothetical protein
MHLPYRLEDELGSKLEQLEEQPFILSICAIDAPVLQAGG